MTTYLILFVKMLLKCLSEKCSRNAQEMLEKFSINAQAMLEKFLIRVAIANDTT
jgi:hypothetical protein